MLLDEVFGEKNFIATFLEEEGHVNKRAWGSRKCHCRLSTVLFQVIFWIDSGKSYPKGN